MENLPSPSSPTPSPSTPSISTTSTAIPTASTTPSATPLSASAPTPATTTQLPSSLHHRHASLHNLPLGHKVSFSDQHHRVTARHHGFRHPLETRQTPPHLLRSDSAFKHISHLLYNRIFRTAWSKISPYLKVQVTIFVFLSLLFGLIVWGIEKGRGILFVDTLFTCVSAITNTGLTSSDFSEYHLSSQLLVLFLIIIGGQVINVIPVAAVIRWEISRANKKRSAVLQQIRTHNPEYLSKDHRNLELSMDALKRLTYIVSFYHIFMVLFGVVCLLIFMAIYPELQRGVHPLYFAVFHTFSAFNNAGISLYQDNFVGFVNNWPICLLTIYLVIMGYTAFPIGLRISLKLSLLFPKYINPLPSKALLHAPTLLGHLLPALETKVLAIVLVGLIFIGTGSILAIDANNVGLAGRKPSEKFLIAFFNDVNSRISGFNSIDFSQLQVGSILIIICLMLIAAYPVGVRVARSLEPQRVSGYMGLYIKQFISESKYFVFLSLILICIIEDSRFNHDPSFTFLRVIFEVVSALGTVGLSLGYPGVPFSFSGVLSPGSKVLLMGVMLVGRHRKLNAILTRSVEEAYFLGARSIPPDNNDTTLSLDNILDKPDINENEKGNDNSDPNSNSPKRSSGINAEYGGSSYFFTH
eukprot:TRINITY_DN6478_c0_g1_i3.p1 TRINITY_DN6478_c0_g1~~TRINITY_DN6478_c0_g1_i3.p1  ORF type:complete len:640 (+),score=83.86 TRINITY_DN6478_c0_g1_i3:131-2050(+)